MRRSYLNTRACLATVLVVGASMLGCGDQSAPDTGTTGSSTSTGGGPAPSGSESGSGGPSPDASAAAREPLDKGPLEWADYKGPSVPFDAAGAEDVWCALPVSDNFRSLKLGKKKVLETKEDRLLVAGFRPSWVPGAYVHKVEAPEVAAGDVVLAAVYSTAVVGIVREVGDKVKVDLEWVNKTKSEELAKEDLLKLDPSALSFGSPVGYKNAGKWLYGNYLLTEGDVAWILTPSGPSRDTPAADVKPMTVGDTFAVGDDVWAQRFGRLEPAKVEEILDEGVRITVNIGGQKETLPFNEVTRPLE